MSKTVGIVCEYNPFHNGHRYHIEKAKEISGADSCICIMSGSMVQRGEPAIYDKWQRAKIAIDHGADLVIELPAYYALQSADNFAYGAVASLNSLGVVDYLCFGAETDDLELLTKAASLMANPTEEYQSTIRAKIDSGSSYPQACEYALRKCIDITQNEFFSPNNTLGICYIAALKKLSSAIKPLCIKRANDYHSLASSDGFVSASAIRAMIASGNDYKSFAPDYSSLTSYSLSNADSYILGFFRNADAQSLTDIKGYEEGLANRVISAAKKACTSDELFNMCTTKRYTMHRIRRFCACAMLGIRGEHEPSYVRILGLGKKGSVLIKDIKKLCALPIVTKAADFGANAMYDMDIRATDFAALCADDTAERYSGKDFLKSPYIDKR
ncbi:MAG: nucleotidyltransferase family protein [Clostridia bacterium]|nr:nucleotidyltransferase family protein [Clostridia bacterium]